MATGLFSSSNAKKHSLEASVEDQISEIRDEISSLTKLLSKRSAEASSDIRARAKNASRDVRSRTNDVRDHAEDGLHDLLEAGEEMLEELRHRYAATEKQVRNTVREHPIATLGGAAAVGLLVAFLLRR